MVVQCQSLRMKSHNLAGRGEERGTHHVGYIARGNDTRSKALRDRRRETPPLPSVNNQNMAEDSPSSILDLSPCSTNPANSFPPRRHRPKMHTQQAIPVPRALNLDDNELQLLATVMTEPPVTRETLEELNLDHIMNNINLRADVNFDDELHFRPNTETKKGQQKRRQGELYWQALAVEIKVYQYLAVARCMNTGGNMDQESIMAFRPRLPTMFTRLKDLSKTLVPDRDHEEVEERLDVSLLMQQVERGVLDIIGLSQWLCSLLKNHCAPMRDPEADKIVERMVEGCKVQNTRIIGEGLRYAFAMLETMKLVSIVALSPPTPSMLTVRASGRSQPPNQNIQDPPHRRHSPFHAKLFSRPYPPRPIRYRAIQTMVRTSDASTSPTPTSPSRRRLLLALVRPSLRPSRTPHHITPPETLPLRREPPLRRVQTVETPIRHPRPDLPGHLLLHLR